MVKSRRYMKKKKTVKKWDLWWG